MTIRTSTQSTPATSMLEIVADVRRYLGWRGGLALAGAAVVLGLALNWSWLVAAGVAPVLLSLLPCAAMCALGLCMKKAGACVAPAASRGAPESEGPPRAAEPMTMATDRAADHGRIRPPSAQPGIHHSSTNGETDPDNQLLRTTSYLSTREDH